MISPTRARGEEAVSLRSGVPSRAKGSSTRRRSRAGGNGLLAAGGAALTALGAAGANAGEDTLGLALLLIFAVVFLRRAANWRRAVDLVEIWMAGFLYLYSLEWMSRDEVVRVFGTSTVATAEGFTVAAFGATLVGYVLRRKLGRDRSPYAIRPGHASIARRHRWERIVFRYSIGLASAAIGTLLLLKGVSALVSSGRSGGVVSGLGSMASQAAGLGVVATPVLLGFVLTALRTSKKVRVLAIGGISLALVALVLAGTRFPLGFAAGSLLYLTVLRRSEIRPRQALGFVAAGVVLLLAQGFMMASRTRGVATYLEEGGRLLGAPAEGRGPQAEGLLKVTTVGVVAQPLLEVRQGLEHAFLLYWWVPRDLWPGKPTMAGKWFMREYGDERGFSEGHSFSGGFALAPLIDFGLIFGVVVCVIYGWVLGVADGLVGPARKGRPGLLDLFVAPLFFGVFFMVRSPFTALIVLQTLWMVTVFPIWLLERLGRESRIREPLAQPTILRGEKKTGAAC